MKITPEQVCEALDAWVCRPGMTQEQATILITEAFWALKGRPNIDVQRVTFNDGEVDQRALGVNRVTWFYHRCIWQTANCVGRKIMFRSGRESAPC